MRGLGGAAKVARQLGVTTQAASQWMTADAVPPAHYLPLWRMALEAGLPWEPPGAAELRPLLCQVPAPPKGDQP